MIILLSVIACATDTPKNIGGTTQWIEVAEGRIKTQVFTSEIISDQPVLVFVLHGDIADPKPDYQYLFAKAITQGFSTLPEMSSELRMQLGEDWISENIVAVGILRPGYVDPWGDKSSGDMGMGLADNYTPEVVDALTTVVTHFKQKYHARSVILVGHSGGGAIVADMIGSHSNLADAVLLVACGCDPVAWRRRMQKERPDWMWKRPNLSLIPLSLVSNVSKDTVVRSIWGDQDEVTLLQDSQKYIQALQKRGIDASITVIPGLGHNILFSRASFQQIGFLINRFGGKFAPKKEDKQD